ncbi:MAG: NAD-dependent epimerase/dehydratase family protein [Candidatus Pacebacteria bacterium]|nr:NAD-dependent epimerase/dehydratase family protein [Candidatus Paceibacterota bacterium]
MAQKILITGAAGFIGSHLVDLLLSKNIKPQQLRLLVFNDEPLINLPDKDFEIVRGDVRDPKCVNQAVAGVKTIYHLAARIDFEGKSFAAYQDVNVAGTQNLINAVKKHQLQLQKFVFFSSIAVFGLPADIGEIKGWKETQPKNYTNFYGQSKWAAEKKIVKAHQQWGLPYAIVRPASVYGPREQGPTLALYRAIKNHRFVIIGDGQNKLHYVYVKDLVTGAYLAAQSSLKAGDYILAGAQPTKLVTVVKEVAASINEKVPNWHLPQSLAMLAAYGLAGLGKLTGIKPLLYPSRVRTMTTTYYYDISKAKKELNYQPQISFKQGARLTGQWYLANNYL